jgi:Nucleotidyltransferase of unknown function (DUF6036)
MSPKTLPSPWKDFFREIDELLDEPLALHCVGGFVACSFYGLPRITGDVDFYTAVPSGLNLNDIAGEDSTLAKKHKIRLHHAGVMSLPEDYTMRLTEIAPGQFKYLKLLALDPYDFILSKLERNIERDRDDADYVFKTQKLDVQILRERYERELRPYLSTYERDDTTLKMWIDIFEAKQ